MSYDFFSRRSALIGVSQSLGFAIAYKLANVVYGCYLRALSG